MFEFSWHSFGKWVIDITLPLVACYHLITSNIFLNSAYDEANGLEFAGNIALAPFQYLFAGSIVSFVNEGNVGRYELKQRFNYDEGWAVKGIASLVVLPVSLTVGSILKGLSYWARDVRLRHDAIKSSVLSTEIRSNNEYYASIGIDLGLNFERERFEPLNYERQPEDQNVLLSEKEALKEIIAIFNEKKIVFWVDCGTCLGVYRYGGAIPWDNDIDLAVLEPDFDNIMHALNGLDRKKYRVQDWSNRSQPKTLIRIYIYATNQFIDIYHFRIHPEDKFIQYILSHEDSFFQPKDWKIINQRFKTPTAYEIMFPLKIADYDGIEIFVPKDMERYLKDRYGDNLNPTYLYNCEKKAYEKDVSHPYWQIPGT